MTKLTKQWEASRRELLSEQLLTPSEAQVILPVSLKTLRRMARTGKLTDIRPGGATGNQRYRKSEIVAIAQANAAKIERWRDGCVASLHLAVPDELRASVPHRA